MKKNLILLVVLVLCRNFLFAQRLNEYVPNLAQFNYFSYPCTGPFPSASCRDKEDRIKTEYPPWIIGGGWRSYFFTDGVKSAMASSPASMVTSQEINFKDNGGDPVVVTDRSGCNSNLGQDDQFEPWRLQYYSVYSAQYINHPTAGTVNLAFVEGENYTQSNKWLNVGCAGTGWDSHSTFLCGAWTPNTQATNWGHQFLTDIGPMIWPAAGYFTSGGVKASRGCANNATIQADGYLYVFYKDHSEGSIGAGIGPGRQPGIRVARAPISDALNPMAYHTFYEDASGVHWNQSMPAGFNKNNIVSFYTAPGPQGTVLVEPDRDYTRFAVAKVAGKNYYLAVGSYHGPNGSEVTTLKFSYDLVHWQGDRTIYTAPSIAENKMTYPIFLSADGWTNTSVDEENFYVIGTRPNYSGINNTVYKLRVQIPPIGSPVACNSYMHVGADASGATLGDVDVTGDKLTIEAVFNRTEEYSVADAGGNLVSKHCNTTDANYFLRPKSAGITTSNGYFQVDLPCDLEMNVAYHMAMVYDGANLSIYRNGFLEASVPATGNLVTNDWETTIGTAACPSNWSLPEHFRGYLTEVRIWKQARTQAELQLYRHQTIGNPGSFPNLLAYYTFHYWHNQGSGSGVANPLGTVSIGQTSSSCVIDDVGCFILARKSTGTAPVVAAVANLVLYPNPAQKSATLTYSSSSGGALSINVIDITGKMAMALKRSIVKGTNAINIDLQSLSNGVYTVQVFDGSKTLTKKLVVSK